MTLHSPEDVRVALVRCFLRNGIDREQWMADLVLPIVREVLRARDEEITRLRDLVTTYVMTGEYPGGTPLDHLTPSPAYGVRLLETVRAQGSCCKSLEGNPILSIYSKAAAFAVALAAGGASIILAAGPVSATTLTCTGVANQVTPPLGCGGAQLAYTAKGSLDLAVLGGNYWNSPVGFTTDSTSSSAQDFTVFAVNGSVTDGPGYLGEYVAVYTPDGKFASFTQNGTKYTNAVPAAGTFTVGPNVYAISVEKLGNRWFAVLRNANSNGAFTYGKDALSDITGVSPTLNPTSTVPAIGTYTYKNTSSNVVNVTFTAGVETVTGSGVTGNGPSWAIAPGTNFTVDVTTAPTAWSFTTDNSISASRANRYQVWAPVQGAAGLEMINESLSGGFRNGGTGNTPYVLDDKGFGGTGTRALAFPENDGLNQQFSIVGCTEPITGLNTSYALCP